MFIVNTSLVTGLQCIVDHFLELLLVILTTNTSLVTGLQCIVDQTISAPDVHC
jgi:hypothetical protein